MSGYSSDRTVKAKVLPRNLRGVLPVSSALEMSVITTSRAWRPLPPGNVRLNGQPYATWPVSTTTDCVLTWSHRSRSTQGPGALLVPQDADPGVSLEGTITVEALVAGVVRRTWSGLTGTSQTYTRAQRIADDQDLSKPVQFRLTPVNGSWSGTPRLTPSWVMG